MPNDCTPLSGSKRTCGYAACDAGYWPLPGVTTSAIEGEPVDIVLLLLLPVRAAGEQLTALACGARKLRDADVTSRIRATADAAGVYRAIPS